MGWLYVPATADSTSPADWPSAMPTGLSARLKSKPLLPQSWSRVSRTAPWLRSLSGMTLRPLTANRGVASWISSLLGCRVSRTAQPGSSEDTTMSGPSGPSSSASSPKCEPPWSSSRTSQPSLDGFDQSERLYADWVTSLRLDYGARQKLARRTGGSDSSAWPTPDSYPRGGAQNPEKRQSGGHKTDLQDAAQFWQTPRGRDWKAGGKDCIEPQSQQWQTPSVADQEGGHLSRGGSRKGELLLRGQAKQWATPQAYSFAESHMPGQTKLDIEARSQSSHQGQPSESDGPPSSPSGPTSRPRLNATFVEWLMGLPSGWSDLSAVDPTGFGCWATASCRLLPPRHFGNC